MPLVTVITPVFNAQKYIQRTIDSVANQSYPNIEYILIDDCSPDDSVNISSLPIFARWIRNAKNLGEAASVNLGFELAKGDYILVLSADDLIKPNLIEYAVNQLISSPDIIAVYPNWEIIDSYNGIIFGVETRDYNQRELIEDFLCIPGPGCIFKNPTQFNLKRNPDLRYVSDYDFWIKLSTFGNFKKLNYLGAAWRKNEVGASSHRNSLMSEERIRVIINAFELDGIAKKFDYRKALSAAYYHAARLRLFNGNIGSRRMVLKSYLYDWRKRKDTTFVRPLILTTLLLFPLSINIVGFIIRKSFFAYVILQHLSLRFGFEISDFLSAAMKSRRESSRVSINNLFGKKPKKILLIGMYGSVHFRSWISSASEHITNLKFLDSDASRIRIDKVDRTLKFVKRSLFSYYRKNFLKRLFGDNYQSVRIYKAIRKQKPNLIHVHEMQSGGYPLLPVLEYLGPKRNFDLYLSSWGSDLSLYGQINSHKLRISKLLNQCQRLSVENEAEYSIAIKLGYKGEFMMQVLNSGGVDCEELSLDLHKDRRGIVVKGYQDAHGRALNILAALTLSKFAFTEPIWIYSASPDVVTYVEYLRSTTNLDINVISTVTNPIPKRSLRAYFDQAKVYIGNSISDGASTSMLEAMASGAIVLQSTNSLADSLIVDGENGYRLVWWDVMQIANSIDSALSNFSKFKSARQKNWNLVKTHFNKSATEELICKLYE